MMRESAIRELFSPRKWHVFQCTLRICFEVFIMKWKEKHSIGSWGWPVFWFRIKSLDDMCVQIVTSWKEIIMMVGYWRRYWHQHCILYMYILSAFQMEFLLIIHSCALIYTTCQNAIVIYLLRIITNINLNGNAIEENP